MLLGPQLPVLSPVMVLAVCVVAEELPSTALGTPEPLTPWRFAFVPGGPPELELVRGKSAPPVLGARCGVRPPSSMAWSKGLRQQIGEAVRPLSPGSTAESPSAKVRPPLTVRQNRRTLLLLLPRDLV